MSTPQLVTTHWKIAEDRQTWFELNASFLIVYACLFKNIPTNVNVYGLLFWDLMLIEMPNFCLNYSSSLLMKHNFLNKAWTNFYELTQHILWSFSLTQPTLLDLFLNTASRLLHRPCMLTYQVTVNMTSNEHASSSELAYSESYFHERVSPLDSCCN